MASNGDMDVAPAYQRGSVWTWDQRVSLVRSWLSGIPVPAVTINDRLNGVWPTTAQGLPVDGFCYAVVDGRQRIETAQGWFDGSLPVPASWFAADAVVETVDTPDGPYVTYRGLTEVEQRHVANRAFLPMVEARLGSLAEEASLYLVLNGGGTPQTDADMANAASVAAQTEGK